MMSGERLVDVTPPEHGRVGSAEFEPEPASARAAREFVAEQLKRWGCSEQVVEDARLVVSELATNAIVHAGTRFTVRVSLEARGLRLEVLDASPHEPAARPLQPAATSGRGLHMVGAIAQEWGAVRTGHGKVVWAALATAT